MKFCPGSLKKMLLCDLNVQTFSRLNFFQIGNFRALIYARNFFIKKNAWFFRLKFCRFRIFRPQIFSAGFVQHRKFQARIFGRRIVS